jgi:hypothetical protein
MTEFMIMFVRTAPLSEKYESARKALWIKTVGKM